MTKYEEYYTVDEAAATLGRTKSTIYKYIQQGKLTPLEDHKWRMLPGALIPKSQVNNLLEKQEKKLGMTISEAAIKLDVHSSTIKRFINDGLLPSTIGTWRGKTVSFIEEDDLDHFFLNNEEYLRTEKLKRRDYYIKAQNIAYLQKFSSKNGLEARLLIDQEKNLQFLFPNTKELISFEEGIYKYELAPSYSLKFEVDTPTSPGQSIFSIPRYHPYTFEFLDTFYQENNIANMYLDFTNESFLTIYLRNTKIQGVSSSLYTFFHNHIIEGRCDYDEEQELMMVDAEIDTLMINLPKEIKDKIKRKADENKISMQKLVITILKENL